MIVNTTPVTIGLIVLVFAVVSVAVAIVLWLVNRFGAIEKRFDEKVEQVGQTITERLDEIEALHGKLGDRISLMAVAQSEHRTWVAENYVSQRSHETVSAGLTKTLENLQTSLESRLMRLDTKIDAMRA